mmetsp:Transcript_21480/g.63403  ORF Transcript_21480/g.63403 Transcript_21480/m.63403 type:complete len:298 (-) Transcript_21480:282-1175(-)
MTAGRVTSWRTPPPCWASGTRSSRAKRTPRGSSCSGKGWRPSSRAWSSTPSESATTVFPTDTRRVSAPTPTGSLPTRRRRSDSSRPLPKATHAQPQIPRAPPPLSCASPRARTEATRWTPRSPQPAPKPSRTPSWTQARAAGASWRRLCGTHTCGGFGTRECSPLGCRAATLTAGAPSRSTICALARLATEFLSIRSRRYSATISCRPCNEQARGIDNASRGDGSIRLTLGLSLIRESLPASAASVASGSGALPKICGCNFVSFTVFHCAAKRGAEGCSPFPAKSHRGLCQSADQWP